MNVPFIDMLVHPNHLHFHHVVQPVHPTIPPSQWATGGDPMTKKQASFLDKLSYDLGVWLPFLEEHFCGRPHNVTKAQAYELISMLIRGERPTQAYVQALCDGTLDQLQGSRVEEPEQQPELNQPVPETMKQYIQELLGSIRPSLPIRTETMTRREALGTILFLERCKIGIDDAQAHAENTVFLFTYT
ncbi:hypothetical protein OBBRIDRAFT_834704 [Obba rivulosa]|uniref:Uncharacterized protein n=1 Tax=Obba rivulosa TaxID=1052685 RepID=A0A8E2DMB7_9APHY|nr:hypothetical protein OBBRIDRAFT_834704 [Obba rivulosa]